jgi:hypothetical protein
MKKSLSLVLITSFLTANNLMIEDSLGRGGVNIAIGGEANSIFANPAGIPFLSNKKLHISLISGNIALSPNSGKFMKELGSASNSSSSEKNKNISDLLNKNIGKPLHLSAHNFSAVYKSEEDFSWLVGTLSSVDASFITHTGFGSLGAMESQVDEYHALVTAIGIQEDNVKYGLTLKAINRYQILHNYSILEMIEANSFSYYFDNEYKKKKFAMALDAGVMYALKDNFYNTIVAFSILNIGNTRFAEMGTINETSNIGISMNPYKNILVGIDYMDVFDQSNDPYASDNLRLGLSSNFFNNSLELSSGVYNESLTLGIDYQFTNFSIGLNTYTTKGYKNQKFREYQLSLAVHW